MSTTAPKHRFYKYIETFIWALIIVLFPIINLIPEPVLTNHRLSLNILALLIAVQTLIYYRLLPDRIRALEVVGLITSILFSFYLLIGIHLTGFLSSIFFVLIYVPILIGAFKLRPISLLILVGLIVNILALDALLFFPETFFQMELQLILAQRLGSIVVIGILSLILDAEISQREKTIESTESERDYAESLAIQMNFLNKQSRAILDSISEAVLGINSAGKIIFYNSYAEKMLGWEELKVVQRDYFNFLLLYPSGESFKIHDLTERFEKDLKIFTKDGQGVSVRLINSPIIDDKGEILGNVLTIRDVTKEKELEEMKFDFVSMAAHELRSPVTIIKGYLAAMDEEIPKKDLKIQKFIRRALVTTDNLRVLVENLLNISQIERGSLKINQEEVDWEGLVSKIVGDFYPRSQEKNIKISIKPLKKKLPKVYVDVFRISEVLSNLLTNALNYTDSGGQITIELSTKNNFVVTEIKDTGLGIPEKNIPQLFQKFYRVSDDSAQGGTGLGLYISKTIVLRHGGRIWVTSKVGVGSSFYFTVPEVHGSEIKKDH